MTTELSNKEKPVKEMIDEHHEKVRARLLAELKKLNKEIEMMVK